MTPAARSEADQQHGDGKPSRFRVLFYAGSWDVGGARTQMTLALRFLDRTRFEPHLLVPDARTLDRRELPEDVRAHSYLNPGQSRTSRWQRIGNIARLLRVLQIDLLFDRTYLATLDAAVACRLRPTPRISMAVADPAVQFRMYARRPRWLWWQISRWAYRSANRVLANSEGLRQQLLDFWKLAPGQVQVQRNGFDFERISVLTGPESEPGRAPHSGKLRLLTVGRIDADKGLDDLLFALAQWKQQPDTPEFVWRIVGSGPAEAGLRQQVTRLGLADCVDFVGSLTNPWPEYQAADLFCLPSHSEGSPNVLIEALACGTPVIAADCPSGPREILSGGEFGQLVPVGKPHDLASALRTFSAAPDLWKQRALCGQATVKASYAAPLVIDQLQQHFLQVLQLTRRP